MILLSFLGFDTPYALALEQEIVVILAGIW